MENATITHNIIKLNLIFKMKKIYQTIPKKKIKQIYYKKEKKSSKFKKSNSKKIYKLNSVSNYIRTT